MGWAGGSEACLGIWKIVRKHIPKKKRVDVLYKIVDFLTTNFDWDTVDELEDSKFPETKEVVDMFSEDEDDE